MAKLRYYVFSLRILRLGRFFVGSFNEFTQLLSLYSVKWKDAYETKTLREVAVVYQKHYASMVTQQRYEARLSRCVLGKLESPLHRCMGTSCSDVGINRTGNYLRGWILQHFVISNFILVKTVLFCVVTPRSLVVSRDVLSPSSGWSIRAEGQL